MLQAPSKMMRPVRRRRAIEWGGALLLLLLSLPVAAEVPATELKEAGRVLMLRHANAPGTGDPAEFRIGDCKTQRNLDTTGRDQARALGDWLRQHGVTSARVYSSQWCRCLETARLLGLGEVGELPALNSFYERPQDRDPNLKALRAFLRGQPRDGELLVLVTHYVTIAGITGQGVGSGEGIVLELTGDGFDTLGRLATGPANAGARP